MILQVNGSSHNQGQRKLHFVNNTNTKAIVTLQVLVVLAEVSPP